MLLCAAGDELGRLFMSIAKPSPEKRIIQKSGPIATEQKGARHCIAKMPLPAAAYVTGQRPRGECDAALKAGLGKLLSKRI